MFLSVATLKFGPQYHLRTAEHGDGLAAFAVSHRCVPELRRAAEMFRFGATGDDAVARGASEIRFEFDGGETAGAFGQGANAAIAAGGIGKRDDRTRMPFGAISA